jgi:hypothetical protein
MFMVQKLETQIHKKEIVKWNQEKKMAHCLIDLL